MDNNDKNTILVVGEEAYSETNSINYQRGDRNRELMLLQSIKHPNIFDSLVDKSDHFQTLGVVIQSKSISDEKILKYAHDILNVLNYLWESKIIFNNLNPSTILINQKDDICKITNFQTFSEIRSEVIIDHKISSLNADLMFISPELTGRMNKSVDYRSDIYSLGAVLYYAFTGKYLFEEKLAHKIIHSHIAKRVAPLKTHRRISSVIDSVVQKMLAKNADERYQSATGLKHDLECCKKSLDSFSDNDDFLPGDVDRASVFHIDENLYGRDLEIDLLLESYSNVAKGRNRVFLVSGHSGIGKTALVNEIKKPITQHDGIFISGKFDQLKRNIPFYGFNMAVNALVDYVFSLDKKTVSEIRNDLKINVGDNISIIAGVIPAVRDLVGDVARNKVDLSTAESLNLFFKTFSNFFNVFKRNGRPLVIFLDDLQWADSSTIGLIKYLITDIQDTNLMIITGYRDNEVGRNHLWQICIDDISRNGGLVDSINLGSLQVENVFDLVKSTFKADDENTQKLAQLLWTKTDGNPFHIQNLIRSFYSKKHVYFDAQVFKWNFNFQEIEKAGISTNLLSLILDSLKNINEEYLDIIKSASVLGAQFDAHTLIEVLNITREQCEKAVRTALDERIIISLDKNYRYILLEENALRQSRFKFSHDKVQQALYEALSVEQRASTHESIAKYYLTLDESDYDLFDLAFHYNKLDDDKKNDSNVTIKINCRAGMKAYEASAYESAMNFLEIAFNSMNESMWLTDYEKIFETSILLFDCYCLSNEMVKAEKIHTLLLIKVNSKIDKARIYQISMNYYSLRSHIREAIDVGVKALKLYGINFPLNTKKIHVLPKLLKVKTLLAIRGEKNLLNAKIQTDPESIAALKILSNMTPSCFMQSPESFLLNALYCMEITLKYGKSDVSAFALSLLGIVEANALGNYKKAEEVLKISMKMNEQTKSKHYLPKIIFAWDNFVQFYHAPIKDSFAWLVKGYTVGLEIGDFNFASYCMYGKICRLFYCGVEIETAFKEVSEYSQFCNKIGDNLMIPLAQIYRRFTYKVSGLKNKNFQELDELFREESFIAAVRKRSDLQSEIVYYIYELIQAFLDEDYERGLSYIIKCGNNVEDGTQKQIQFYEFYFYACLNCIKYLKKNPDTKKAFCERLVKKSLSIFKKFNAIIPVNFRSRYFLMLAEYESYKYGDSEYIIGLYNSAIDTAHEDGFLNIEAIANDLYAQYLIIIKRKSLYTAKILEANILFKKLGYSKKADQLLTQLSTSQNRSVALDDDEYKSIFINASKLISGERNLSDLIKKIKGLIVNYTNAHRCLIIGQRSDKYISYGESEFNTNSDFCKSVVDYVYNKNSIVRIDDTSSYHLFERDPYFEHSSVRSLVAIPLMANNEVRGVVYLENKETSNAFNVSKTKIVEVLSTQIALSLENAFFLDDLEEKVNSRTKELNEKTNELQMSYAEKEVLVRVLCHDLANVTMVNNHSIKVLAKTLESSEDPLIKKHIEKMKNAVKTEGYIINNIRTMEMAKNKLLKIDLVSSNLIERINESTSILEDRLVDKCIVVNIDKNLEGVEVVVDEVSFVVNVLNNIFSNAIKFSFRDSRIDCYLEEETEDSVVVAIKDYGTGMPKDFVRNLFKKEVHDTSPGTGNEKGSGFGLNLIKVFMHKFQGNVSVKSIYQKDDPINHGTIFYLTLTKSSY